MVRSQLHLAWPDILFAETDLKWEEDLQHLRFLNLMRQVPALTERVLRQTTSQRLRSASILSSSHPGNSGASSVLMSGSP